MIYISKLWKMRKFESIRSLRVGNFFQKQRSKNLIGMLYQSCNGAYRRKILKKKIWNQIVFGSSTREIYIRNKFIKWKRTIHWYSYGILHMESVEYCVWITVCSVCSAICLSLVVKYVDIREFFIFDNSSFVDMVCIVWILIFGVIGDFSSFVLLSIVYTAFFLKFAERSFLLLLLVRSILFAVRSQFNNSWTLHFWYFTIGRANHWDWSLGKSAAWS